MSTSATALTPGQQLSQARLAQGKSLTEISKATLILESRLEAIERDDYGAVGTSQAFVVGYVKAFAKQVDVPEAPLLKVLAAYFKQRKLTRAAEQPDLPKRSSRNIVVPLLAALIAAASIVALGQWFFMPESQSAGAAQPAMSSVEQAVVLNKRSEAFVHDELVNRQSEIAQLVETTATVEQDATYDKAAVPGVVLDSIPVEENPESGVEPLPIDELVEQPIDINSDYLVLTFAEDCWVEVFSAAGERLASRLAKAGSTLKYSGKAPFDLKLGNAQGVNVMVNNRDVALDIPDGRRVLRIQVGP